MQLLHVDSSITGPTSLSRQLSAAVGDHLRAGTPHLQVIRRDLAADPLPVFDAATLGGLTVRPEPQGPEHAAQARLDRQVLDEFMAADVVVIGAPMYNFGVPAQLKTWIDYLSVAGVTFRYTPQGPVGLAGGKRVILASTRGGLYGPGAPAAAMEHQESYLQAVLGFFGITDVDVIRAEGLKMGPDQARQAVAEAMENVRRLPVRLGVAA
jgi:FMN-dependent NADH-azoreductase